MAEAVGALPLLIWFSPAFPVGAFAYSHGLEWAVEEGSVRDAASLRDWLADLLGHGGIRNDAILFANAWHAAVQGDAAVLAEISALALALAGSRERLLETSAQGNAFVAAARAAWPCAALEMLTRVPSPLESSLIGVVEVKLFLSGSFCAVVCSFPWVTCFSSRSAPSGSWAAA